MKRNEIDLDGSINGTRGAVHVDLYKTTEDKSYSGEKLALTKAGWATVTKDGTIVEVLDAFPASIADITQAFIDRGEVPTGIEFLEELLENPLDISSLGDNGDSVLGGGSTPPVPLEITATASAIPTSTFTIDEITIDEAGSGYTSAPTVTVSAPDSVDAAASGTPTSGLGSGLLNTIDVDTAGQGYATAPSVTISAPDSTNASLSGSAGQTAGVPDADQSALISQAGSGYVVPPLIEQAGGTGSGATLTATLDAGGAVISIASSGGTGYVGDESYTIETAPFVQAVATATIGTSGEVTGISVDTDGEGYLSNPTITLDAAPSEQAVATATLSADAVDSITVGTIGEGYVAVPTITVAAP